MQKKTVKFDQLKPWYLKEGENQESLYNLGALLRLVTKTPLIGTSKRIYGDVYRFHICNYDEKLKIWEIQILHLREKLLPGIADSEGAYELIQLEDGQYPAESTTFLFDETHSTLYMQRNIFGISIKNMEQYIQQLSPKGISVLLKPVRAGNRISKIVPSSLYRKVILVADIEQFDEKDKNKTLYKTLNSFGRYQGRIVKVDLGFGHERTGLLNATATTDLIKEAYGFSGTQVLKVRQSDPDDVLFETLDLLDDCANYKLDIEYSRDNPITHGRLYYLCEEAYKRERGINS